MRAARLLGVGGAPPACEEVSSRTHMSMCDSVLADLGGFLLRELSLW